MPQICDGRDKVTPLHLACSWGQLEVAKVLLEFGADSSAKDCNEAFPEGVIGAASPDAIDPACARELSEVVVGHRLRIKGGFQLLESRQVYEHVLALEDEAAGLRVQLRRFSRRVRDLVAVNGDLKLDVRRARADILVLNAERKGLEERLLLRTPSPPPTPPVGDVALGSDRSAEGARHGGEEATTNESVAKDGSVDEAGWVQQVGNDQSGGEEATAGDFSCAGANLHHANLAGGGDHAESENMLTRDEGSRQIDGASSPEVELKVVAIVGGGDGGHFEAAGVEASTLTVEVSGRRGADGPGFESSSCGESDADTWASIDRKVRSRSPRSSVRRAFDSCDSASSEHDAQDMPAELAGFAEPREGANCGEIVSTAQQAAGTTFDKALEPHLGRPCRRPVFKTRSLQSNLPGTYFGADEDLGKEDMGGSGMSFESPQPRSKSLPGSFLVAGDGGHEEAQSSTSRAGTSTPVSQFEERGTSLAKFDGVAGGSSSDESSNSQVKDGIWSSASFIAAKKTAEGIRGDDDKGEAQEMANFTPLVKTSRANTQSSARR
eukprot:g13411.t1